MLRASCILLACTQLAGAQDEPPTVLPFATSTNTPAAPASVLATATRPNIWEPQPEQYQWDLPALPALSTPTLLPTYTPNPNEAAANEILSTNVYQAGLAASTIQALGTPAAAAQSGGSGSFSDTDGSPFEPQSVIDTWWARISEFFSYVKGMSPARYGKFAEIVSFWLVLFVLVFIVEFYRLLLRMIDAGIVLVRRLISFTLQLWEAFTP